jgi:carbonic anhydrase/acetyltransferase-like protein (isoleucine patch superfamily)
MQVFNGSEWVNATPELLAERSINVDQTAMVHPTARIGHHVDIGPLCIIGAGAVIGHACTLTRGVIIGYEAVIAKHTTLNNFMIIGHGSFIDYQPEHFLYYSGSRYPLIWKGGKTVTVGCMEVPIETAKEKLETIAADYFYDEYAREEYWSIITVIKKLNDLTSKLVSDSIKT